MLLYIARHAEAEVAKGAPRESPDSWHVTEDGRRAAAQAAAAAERELAFHPELILSSPSPRARESAEAIRDALGGVPPVAVETAVGPDATPTEFYRALQARKDSGSVVVVTHIPLISRLVPDLLGAGPAIELLQGGIACVQCKDGVGPGKGTLVWLLPPRRRFDGKEWA